MELLNQNLIYETKSLTSGSGSSLSKKIAIKKLLQNSRNLTIGLQFYQVKKRSRYSESIHFIFKSS